MKKISDIVFERELSPGESFDRDDRDVWKIKDRCTIYVTSLNKFMEGSIVEIDKNSDPICYKIEYLISPDSKNCRYCWSQSVYPP